MFKNIKTSRWAVIHVLFLLSLLILAVLLSGSQNPVRMTLQRSVFDNFNHMHPRTSTREVVIVDVDEKSLELIGQWNWPRDVMADLTKSLSEKGAKVIAFDGVFAEPDRTSPHILYKDTPSDQIAQFPNAVQTDGVFLNYDDLFAQEIKKSKIFVTAFTYGRSDRAQTQPLNKNRLVARSDVKSVFLENASRFKAAAVNLPILSKAAAGNGSFMAKPDDDGILRRVGMVFTNGKHLYPSLSLEALRVALLGRKEAVKLAKVPEDERGEIDTNYRILIGDKAIPVESDGILYVRYRHFCNHDDVRLNPLVCSAPDYIPAYKFLIDEYSKEAEDAVKGKVVLIGASAEGLKDLRSTALSPFRPGVEVHANVIEQILSDDYLLRPSVMRGAEAIFIMVAGAFFIIVSPFIGILVSVALCITIISVAFFGAYYAYVEHGLLVDSVYPSLAVMTIFIVSTILSYARAEARRKQIRNAFGMYVAGDVMRDLEQNPEKLKLGGENRDLTVMFTDIRKFTTISEGLSPEELILLMNEFLTSMTDIVMQHQGTVDKYIGDAMMSFWNAPRDIENHEREACLAALAMQTALEPVNEKIRIRAQEEGKDAVLLNAGIGINSGSCAVGNMGSKQRFAYSALGDPVNLSSRLEGQTKFYGINILVGEATYKAADDYAMIELDMIKLVGKKELARIYGLFGDHDYAKQEQFINWKSTHQKMMDCYRSQSFDEALNLADECKSIAGESYVALYDMYITRMNALKSQDLPQSWDGSIEAEGK